MVYFLDVFLFVFLLQFLFYYGGNFLKALVSSFLGVVRTTFDYDFVFAISSLVSLFTFLVLLVCCFGGYFCYSFVVCRIIEFTFVYALLA